MLFFISIVNASVWYAVTQSWLFTWATWAVTYITLTFIDVFCGDD